MTRLKTLSAALVAAGLTTAGLAACGGASHGATKGDHPSSASIRGTITIFAAASLAETFTSLAHAFEAAHPGVVVKLNFGGSDTLAAQITQGAPADAFAAASSTTMSIVTRAGDAAAPPTVFARNVLEIATAKGNPRHVATLAAAVAPGVKLAMCAPAVPCGAAARTALAAAGLHAHPVTLEPDVKGVLTKVELGEVDVGMVYRTDVIAAAGKVAGIDFPQAQQAVNSYPIALLHHGGDSAAARAFVQYVLGPVGKAALHQAGFLPP
jgi:molybdate transport system substrate-binding protein